MTRSNFIEFLRERNRDFIHYYSSESAIGLIETLKGGVALPDGIKNCVMVSIDPPMGYPPIVFNWGEREVWYVKSPGLEQEIYEEIDVAINKSKQPFIVFLEKDGVPHKRKIQRFIKNYRKQIFRNRSLAELPKFILAEYRGPLSRIKLSELTEETYDTLPA